MKIAFYRLVQLQCIQCSPSNQKDLSGNTDFLSDTIKIFQNTISIVRYLGMVPCI